MLHKVKAPDLVASQVSTEVPCPRSPFEAEEDDSGLNALVPSLEEALGGLLARFRLGWLGFDMMSSGGPASLPRPTSIASSHGPMLARVRKADSVRVGDPLELTHPRVASSVRIDGECHCATLLGFY